MNDSPLRSKAYSFALNIVKICSAVQKTKKEYVLTKQLLKSGTSIGANLAEAKRAQSKNDFYAKVYISNKEASESEYWIRLLRDSGYISKKTAQGLLDELSEIIAMLVSTLKTIHSTRTQ